MLFVREWLKEMLYKRPCYVTPFRNTSTSFERFQGMTTLFLYVFGTFKMCKSPGQCVILCIIVNFTVIVQLSDFNLALGLLICFLKETMMLL